MALMNVDWLQHPFVYGLSIGLLGMGLVWLSGVVKRRHLVRELNTLRTHLHRQMEISQKGQEKVQQDVEALRQQNENLRITNATLKQKPGRSELQTLVAYDKALRMMQGRVPGFAPAWESVLTEAEKEVQKSESGLLPLIRKAFRPSLRQGEVGEGSENDPVDLLKKELPERGGEASGNDART